jgi:hypothetical protein
MPDVGVQKERAGSVSTGRVWAEDGATVVMPLEEALALVAIRDAGFSLVPLPEPEDEQDEGPSDPAETTPDLPVTEPGSGQDLSEVAPEPQVAEPEPVRRAAKKTAASKVEA